MREVDPTRPWTRLYPDWVPNELPIPTESMADVLEATARAAGEAPAIHYFDATISYTRLDDLASRFATLLASWGVGHGDRVALYLQNVPQYIIALHGIWKRGAIAVPLNPMFKAKELAYHLEDSGARLLVALESLYEGVARGAAPGSPIEQVVTTNEFDMLGSEPPAAVFAASKKAAPAGTIDMLAALDQTTADPRARLPVAPHDLASLGYTSGTTGQPKGAMSSHKNIAYNANFYRVWLQLDASDIILGVAPLFHITGMVARPPRQGACPEGVTSRRRDGVPRHSHQCANFG